MKHLHMQKESIHVPMASMRLKHLHLPFTSNQVII
jgi:hypothetical protein